MRTETKNGQINLADDVWNISDHINVLAPAMFDDELEAVGESLYRLEAFFNALPNDIYDEIISSRKYASTLNTYSNARLSNGERK